MIRRRGGSGGLNEPLGVTFGPDGNLYVASSGGRSGDSAVLRYQGPSGPMPGAFIDAFVPPGSGGLLTTQAALFGPDGNGDGHQDLYVTTSESTGEGAGKGKNGSLKRYDGVTGAFIDTFIPIGSGRLNSPSGLTFTETDPMTLAYTGDRLTAAATASHAVNELLSAGQVQPVLTEALTRWQGSGVAVSTLSRIDVRIADLSGATLGEAVGHTIWLDTNAAGWGWFMDATPGNDSEYLTPGDQGEQGRMDLLTAIAHELGHLLGYEHSDAGTMHDTLATGERLMPTSSFGVLQPVLVDLVLFDKKKAWVTEPSANDPLHDLVALRT